MSGSTDRTSAIGVSRFNGSQVASSSASSSSAPTGSRLMSPGL
jgi:hypothetical protein